MIDFIICEDEKELCSQYKIIIEKIMMNYDIDYNIICFDGYTKEWKRSTTRENYKIYILDLKTKEGSGLDAARYIREEQEDWQSMIIMVTAFAEYKYEALGKRLMLVDFVGKLDNMNARLIESIKIALKNYDTRPNSLRYTYKDVLYNIEFHKILYIEKEQDNKRCIIRLSDKKENYIPGNLSQIAKKLDKRFIKCNRSFIINIEQVGSYDIKDNIITFKNGEKLYAVSRNKKKEIINYVRNFN